MSESATKTLRLVDMVFNRQGNYVRRFVHTLASLALRLFFRRIETVNSDAVPSEGALIFVLNHPNGLVDPALVFVALPRKISFLAKSTLFKIPVLAYILRLVEALPVYRKIDAADVTKNLATFEACHDLLQKGGTIALFPEGVSHNSPKLLPVKTGAARIALGAISGAAGEVDFDLRIVPVGLYYTNKTTFRSEALLYFGEPFEVLSPRLEDDGDLSRDDVVSLTNKIEQALLEVTVNAESQAELQEAHESANLFFSVSETLDLEESVSRRFDFVRRFIEGGETDSHLNPSLIEKISGYKKKLRELGLEPDDLSLSNEPVWYVIQKFVLKALVLLLLLPLSIIGTILHFPAYQVSKLMASRYTHHGVDDIISTVKIISGLILIPLTWILAAGLAYYLSGRIESLLVLPAGYLLGYTALRSWEEYAELRGWIKAAWLFISKRGLFFELLSERRQLRETLKKFDT